MFFYCVYVYKIHYFQTSSQPTYNNTVSVKAFSINTFKNFNFQTKVNHTQSVKSNQCITCLGPYPAPSHHHYHLGMYSAFASSLSPGYVWPVFIITWVCMACFHLSPGYVSGVPIITPVFTRRSHHHTGAYKL